MTDERDMSRTFMSLFLSAFRWARFLNQVSLEEIAGT